MDVSQAVRMLKRQRRQMIKDVVGADYKPSWGDNVRARAVACFVPLGHTHSLKDRLCRTRRALKHPAG